MTDPADDGLRMPLPLASMKIKKPKKKKKWSQRNYKKKWFFKLSFPFLQLSTKIYLID